jgi:hypothetical protein
VSRWGDGDTKWLGMSFKPVFERGQERNEHNEAYFGGHSFLDHGLTQLIRSTSWATDIPDPFCALVALNTFSTACGKGLQVSFKLGEETSLGTYALVFARSGTGKSKASRALSGPFLDLHCRLIEEWELNLKPKLNIKKKALGSKLARLEKEYSKGESEEVLDQMTEVQASTDGWNEPSVYGAIWQT